MKKIAKPIMEGKRHICSCHRQNDYYGEKYGCLIECGYCSGAKEVNIKYMGNKKIMEIKF